MPDLAPAFDQLDKFVVRQMGADGTPGLAVALTDRDGLLRVAGFGAADLAVGTPVAAETRFQIGSISKAFAAVALLQLRDEGRVDLDAPVTRYLPWFAVGGASAPITLHDLLGHTAGIVAGMDGTPEARSEVWALRQTVVGGPPGERFHYSNVGYKALGLVIEQITGESSAETTRRRILEPLGMADSEASITHDTRRRLAVGHAPLYDDRPAHPDHPLVPATWLQTDTADGAIVATAADLATFLRMLLNRGVGPRGRVLSEEAFALLTRPGAPGWGSDYGYGLMIWQIDGRTEIGHPGGMVGFTAGMRGALDDGLGAVAICNGLDSPFLVTRYALDLLRAAHADQPLPPPPEVHEPRAVPNAADYAGRYAAVETQRFVVEAAGSGLLLRRDADALPVARGWGDDEFVVDHPAFARFPLCFEREDGRVVAAIHGGDWYAKDDHPAPPPAEHPAAWTTYAGQYRSHNPWIPTFVVLLRRGRLRLLFPAGAPDGFDDDQPLHPLADDLFRVGDDEAGPERLRFDVPLDGLAHRATLSGAEYWRCATG